MLLLDRISTRQIAAACLLPMYAAFALRQPETVTLIFVASSVVTAVLMVLPASTALIRIALTALAYGTFVAGRFETRRLAMATAVAVWIIVTTYYAERVRRLGRAAIASAFGTTSDLWLISILTLLTLEGYIVTGLLLISAASWLPRAGRMKPWLAIGFALLGGWVIIAAKLDFNLEMRRWYLLGALVLGIAASLLASAQEVQQCEDVHPQ